MINVLRWIAVAPITILGFAIGLFLSLLLHDGIKVLCSKDEMISGMCIAQWFHYAEITVFCFGAALTACLVIALAVLIAPSRRVGVALAVFGIGCMVAFKIALETTLVAASVTSVIAGLLGVYKVIKLFGKTTFTHPA
jgi:hypothetical protein